MHLPLQMGAPTRIKESPDSRSASTFTRGCTCSIGGHGGGFTSIGGYRIHPRMKKVSLSTLVSRKGERDDCVLSAVRKCHVARRGRRTPGVPLSELQRYPAVVGRSTAGYQAGCNRGRLSVRRPRSETRPQRKEVTLSRYRGFR